MCYIMGLMGYLAFRDAVDGDVLSNFTGSVASVFKAVFVTHLTVYTPGEARFFLWHFTVFPYWRTSVIGPGSRGLKPD